VNLLLDSHAVLAIAFDPPKLSNRARDAIQAPGNVVFISAISPYELELKKALGKLGFPSVVDWSVLAAQAGWQVLAVSISHGVNAARLPQHHGDPWDRLLVAQAMVEAMTLVTSDKRIVRYSVPTLW
jgi:PIN domain nuclease of toxin-antitoxin system